MFIIHSIINVMKIGVLFYGDLYLRHRDWERTKQEVKEKIIDCWGDNEVKVYFSISPTPSQSLLDFYKPVKCNKTVAEMVGKVKDGLESILSEDLDFVIVTRLDVVFFKRLSELNLDFNKFNFLFREYNHWDGPKREWWERYYTCDILLAFPAKYIQPAIDSIWDTFRVPPIPFAHLHTLCSFLVPRIGMENINIVEKEEMMSGSGYNKYYLLDRYNTVKGDLGPTNIDDFLSLRQTDKKLYQGDVF